MSHRWDCPTRWQAEREGERAFERGSGRWNNPYDRQRFERDNCREAQRSWEDGHRQAERRAEEQAIERRQSERREQEREWARLDQIAQEQAEWERHCEEAQQADYEAAMEAQADEHYFWLEQEYLMDVVCA